MEEFVKFTAKTVEDALMEAAIELQTSKENIEYRVVVKETKGFLGFGAKQAVIEARRKKTDEELLEEVLLSKKEIKEEKAKAARSEKAEKKAAPKKKEEKQAKEPKKEEKPVKADKKPAKPEKEIKDKKEQAPKKPVVKEAAKDPVKETKSEAETARKESRPRAERTPAEEQEAAALAAGFLKETIEAMGLEVEITSSFDGDVLSLDLAGKDMGILIGKRGQTLDSLQYLTSLVVNKGKSSYVRVKIDTENYRERRKETLENLARNIAFKVRKTRRSVFLEPMNPNERRIIHSALQDDPYVTTHSEGEEPCRKVVITLKKRTPGTFSEQKWDDMSEE